jgi:hypothetical protein
MNNHYTENLSDFGYRELSLFKTILDHWIEQGLPENFTNETVRPAMNRNSGSVFLVNEDYQVAMMNENKLDLFHTPPYGNAEGFLSDLIAEYTPEDLRTDDIQYLLQAAEAAAFVLPKPWLEYKP